MGLDGFGWVGSEFGWVYVGSGIFVGFVSVCKFGWDWERWVSMGVFRCLDGFGSV